jgi:hypothetical protein
LTAKLKPLNFDYELFSQAQQDFEKTELLRVNLMHLLAAFELLYYRATLWKYDRFDDLNDIKKTNQDSGLTLAIFSEKYQSKMKPNTE